VIALLLFSGALFFQGVLMSHYSQIKTKMTNTIALCAALEEVLHIKPLIYEIPQNLHGYYGNTTAEKAHVVVSHKILGTNADLGYHRDEQGNYSLIWDSYEFEYGKVKHLNLAELPSKVNMAYAKHQTLAIAREQGREILIMKTVDGRLEIRLGAPRAKAPKTSQVRK
jgi:Protein of unknown function (DUF1257)